MQISSVSSANFEGRHDNSVDAFINMNDANIRQVAYLQTASNIDTKKNRRTTNALFYTAPVAAGLLAALTIQGKSKIFSKEVSGLAARVANGLKFAAMWTACLAAVDLVGAAGNKLSRESSEVRKFNSEHPVMSFATTIAAVIGALTLVKKGTAKIYAMEAPEFLSAATAKTAKFINTNKTIGSFKSGLKSLWAKTPDTLKQTGAYLLSWAPLGLLLGGMFHSISSSNAQTREFIKNYSNLKETQTALSQARVQELSLKNDFLMQDPSIRKKVRVMENNFIDLPEDVVEKAQYLQNARQIAVDADFEEV